MRIHKALPILMLAGSVLSVSARAADSGEDFRELRSETVDADGWVPVRTDQRHEIQTWAKREDGKSIRSFRVRSEMTGTVDRVVRLLLDYDNWKRWSWKVSESRLLKKVSDTEYYAYITHQSPVGIPDRDVVLHMRFEPAGPGRPFVIVRFTAEPDFIAEVSGFVRIRAENMTMRIQSLPGGRVRVENEGYVDPGGRVPSWAINFVQRNVPYAIMLGMQRVIESNALPMERRVPFATE